MKKIFAVVSFAAGAAIGAVVGMLVTKKKMEKELDRQIQSIEDQFCDKTYKRVDAADSHNIYKSDSQIVNDILGEKERSIKTTKPRKEPIDYTRFAKSSVADYAVPEIEIVSYEEFQASPNQDHILEFYIDDQTVVDDDGNIINNYRELIGDVDPTKYNLDEDGRMYIINHKLNEDYQVIFCDRAYNDTSDKEDDTD